MDRRAEHDDGQVHRGRHGEKDRRMQDGPRHCKGRHGSGRRARSQDNPARASPRRC